jgi:hypothetical protein
MICEEWVAWRKQEDARLKAVSERLSKPRQSALLNSLEQVFGPMRKSTPQEKAQLLQIAWARYLKGGKRP